MKLTVLLCAILCAPDTRATAQQMPPATTPLAALLAEADTNNSQVAVATDSWKASTHLAQQVTALPDPQLTIQSFSVGSPKPFAGFSNSDFAYIGLGASQDLPYPGKLRLKGTVADRDAATQKANINVVRASVAEQVKLAYLRLAYFEATLAILQRTDGILRPMIDNALSRYSLGQGSQAGVIKAQLEHTKILREITQHHQEMGQLQADLKQLLHRSQESPDIMPDPLTATTTMVAPEDIESLVRGQNPTLQRQVAAVEKQNAQLTSARLGTKPDFTAAYMFQLTGVDYRNYYMLTVSMRLPRRGRINAEIAEASEQANRARHEVDAEIQQQLAESQKQYVALTSSEQLLTQYRQGLVPQAQAVVRSEQSAYQANQQEFAPVLTSLLDLLTMEHDYQQSLLDHETALVRLETLTGASLR